MKTAIITGGSRGIGRVTAMRLLLDGWRVAFTYGQSEEAALAFESESKEAVRRASRMKGVISMI